NPAAPRLMKLPLGPVETRTPCPPKDMPTPHFEKLSRKGPSEMLRRHDQPILHLTHRPFSSKASTFASPEEGSGPAPLGSCSASSGVFERTSFCESHAARSTSPRCSISPLVFSVMHVQPAWGLLSASPGAMAWTCSRCSGTDTKGR